MKSKVDKIKLKELETALEIFMILASWKKDATLYNLGTGIVNFAELYGLLENEFLFPKVSYTDDEIKCRLEYDKPSADEFIDWLIARINKKKRTRKKTASKIK